MSPGVVPAGSEGSIEGVAACCTRAGRDTAGGSAGTAQALQPAVAQAAIAMQASWQHGSTLRATAVACCRHSRITNDRATKNRMAAL